MTLRHSCALTFIALFVPRCAFACSLNPALGPATIQSILRPPFELWAVSILAALLWIALGQRRERTARWGKALLLLAASHPVLWLLGTADCGMRRNEAAFLAACASAGVLLIAAVLAWRRSVSHGYDAPVN